MSATTDRFPKLSADYPWQTVGHALVRALHEADSRAIEHLVALYRWEAGQKIGDLNDRELREIVETTSSGIHALQVPFVNAVVSELDGSLIKQGLFTGDRELSPQVVTKICEVPKGDGQILMDEPRRRLLTYSSEFQQATWASGVQTLARLSNNPQHRFIADKCQRLTMRMKALKIEANNRKPDDDFVLGEPDYRIPILEDSIANIDFRRGRVDQAFRLLSRAVPAATISETRSAICDTSIDRLLGHRHSAGLVADLDLVLTGSTGKRATKPRAERWYRDEYFELVGDPGARIVNIRPNVWDIRAPNSNRNRTFRQLRALSESDACPASVEGDIDAHGKLFAIGLCHPAILDFSFTYWQEHGLEASNVATAEMTRGL